MNDIQKLMLYSWGMFFGFTFSSFLGLIIASYLKTDGVMAFLIVMICMGVFASIVNWFQFKDIK